MKKNPLLEAWLEIRWQLESGELPGLKKDPGFPFALGAFYQDVKDKFKVREKLDASNAPEEMLPYVVRYRFRPAEDQWPVLQLGPGIATVNFTDSYSWDDFLEHASYLRNKLLSAYGEPGIRSQTINLRYRNGVPFEYTSSNPLRFLEESLNTSITLPSHIPGPVSSTSWPKSAKLNLSFDLLEPKSSGRLQLATAIRRREDPKKNEVVEDEMLLWELEVSSKDEDAPELYNEDEFSKWLNSAHAVIHEWFFSLIEGPIFSEFKDEAE